MVCILLPHVRKVHVLKNARGGAPPVELAIENLLISASKVGNDLREAIQTRINEFKKEIEGI